MPRRKRVLFFAEAVTLAHVARPLALASALDPAGHEVHLACSPRYRRFTESEAWGTVPLDSISTERFTDALARGAPVYDLATLRRYVAEDLELMRAIRPDVVIGDFRLSLSVSARQAGVRYATISNAYWSPGYRPKRFPVPVLPITRALPVEVARVVFNLARPAAFAWHCRPLNQLRREHGLAPLGHDLRHAYTDADDVLYADVPAMFPIDPMPARHHYLGPVTWSPPASRPAWWHELPAGRPLVYVTLGSSGSARTTQVVCEALSDEPVTVLASTAGAQLPPVLPANVHAAEYLPGTEAAARARLVVCNGGSPTSQQALAAGVPVLGIASNLDQFLNMSAVEAAGAGMAVRADRLDAGRLRMAVRRLLERSEYLGAARDLAGKLREHDAMQSFRNFMGQVQTG